ncbi:hypothetical protein AMATHDRAFT_11173 [Amanita thiersii Skay4041]|uniref:Uncharacterized protein n=1 Tax=Amanita thiersii Skay4041 TaxID=703135 RepID=A0A2A9NA93_9AGAR|nr:hypothetical protein AMATHDRAFT_11173 [Amanita thiersii Skay4041]
MSLTTALGYSGPQVLEHTLYNLYHDPTIPSGVAPQSLKKNRQTTIKELENKQAITMVDI